MDLKTYLINQLKGNIGFVTNTLSDFTDADMFTRPCPGANHPAWQLGHLISSEAGTQQVLAPSLAVALPDGFRDVYNMKANVKDGAENFAPFNTKAQLIEWYTRVRLGTVACVESMTSEQLDAKTPDKFAAWAPTFSLLITGQIGHTLMHVGQFQVLRRKLGKPVLF